MGDALKNMGQAWIRDRVLADDLCTGCGACVGLCPYQRFYKDATAVIHDCDRPGGRCAAYCPRSPGEPQALREALYDPADLIPGLGAVKGLYTTRAADPDLRRQAQHGGTVTALVSLALAEGIIDTAVLADREEDLLSRGDCVDAAEEAAVRAGSKFVVSPTAALFNQASQGEARAIGVVATPCQALALAKMRVRPQPGDEARVAKLALVIGLFCGWALSWRELKTLLAAKVPGRVILGMDIPPSKHACMEVYTDQGTVEIAIDEVQACVRSSCHYCPDMTCELADLAVGGARSPEGWEVDRGWNQVLVRNQRGQELLDLARERGVLEFKETPEGNLEKLRAASMKKKRTCRDNLAAKTGSPAQLIFTTEDELLCR